MRYSRSRLLGGQRGVGPRVLAMWYYSGFGCGGIARTCARGVQVESEGGRGSHLHELEISNRKIINKKEHKGLAKDELALKRDSGCSEREHPYSAPAAATTPLSSPSPSPSLASLGLPRVFTCVHTRDQLRKRGVLVAEYWRVQAKEGSPRYEWERYGRKWTHGVSLNASLPEANTSAPNVIVYSAWATNGPPRFQEMGSHSHQLDNRDYLIL